MAESGESSGNDGDRHWEAVRGAQSSLEQRVDQLSTDFHRFMMEMRREIHVLKIDKSIPPATTPATPGNLIERGTTFGTGKEPRRNPRYDLPILTKPLFLSEGHNPSHHGAFPGSDSDEEPESMDAHGRRYINSDRNGNDLILKIDILVFDGHIHIGDYLDWEQVVDSFFDYIKVVPEKQVKYVVCKLKGGAGAWWL